MLVSGSFPGDPPYLMSAASDPYEVLQVIRGAEPDVIRAAYRALAARWHPDRGASPERMVAINAAWHILGNPERRAAFDQEPARMAAAPVAAPVADRGGPTPAVPVSGLQARRQHDERTTETIVDFGRYEGWTVRALVDHDPDYLRWLARTPIGRRLAPEIEAALIERQGPAPLPAERPKPRTLPFLRPRLAEPSPLGRSRPADRAGARSTPEDLAVIADGTHVRLVCRRFALRLDPRPRVVPVGHRSALATSQLGFMLPGRNQAFRLRFADPFVPGQPGKHPRTLGRIDPIRVV